MIQLNGHSLERFLNLCANKNLYLWNVKKNQEGYLCSISRECFYELKPIAQKTKTKLSIVKKQGLPFFLFYHRKRKLFFAGVLFCLISVYIMSLHIWDIKIRGNYSYTKEELLKFIQQEKVCCGMKKSKLDGARLEEEIRKKYDSISWVCCEVKGTQLIVTIKETSDYGKKSKFKAPCDLVSNKDGVVLSIITRNGTPQVKKGATIKKGDVLISGVVTLLDDAGEPLETEYVSADGDIIAQTVISYHETIDLYYYEKQYTKKEKNFFGATIFTKYFSYFKNHGDYSHYDEIQDTYTLKLGESFYLPFKFHKITIKEYNLVRKKYAEKEVKEVANRKLALFLKHLKEKKVEIIKNNVKIEVMENQCVLQGDIVTKEAVGKVQKISRENNTQETKEDTP